MRNTNRILLLVFSLLISISAISAVSAQNCVCLDANGVLYPASAPANSICYMCGQDGCTPTALTLSVCLPADPQPVVYEVQPTQPPVIYEVQPTQPPVVQEEQPIQQPVVYEELPTQQPVVQDEQPTQQSTQQIELVVLTDPDNSDDEKSILNELNYSVFEVTETEKPGEKIDPIVEVTETEQPDENKTPVIEVTETEQPGEKNDPEVEVTETEQPVETTEPTVEVTETEQPVETTEPTVEVTETEEPGEIVIPGLNISPEALTELSQLLTDEELENLSSVLTLEWLEANSATLSEQTMLELMTLLSHEEPVFNLLGAPGTLPSVEIEGELTDLLLFSPISGTVTTSNVPFIWLYAYDGETGPTDVTFLLQLTITTAADTVTLNTTVSTASCGGNICTYTADLSSYNNSLISWTVGGVYKSGETTVTVPGPTAQTFVLKFEKPEPPEPPKPPKKPEAPVLECPYGTYEVRKIGFYWAPSKYAESYTVEWHDNRGRHGTANLSNSDITCQMGRCNVHLTMPGYGQYAWRVVAKNSLGSAASDEMLFNIRTGVPTPAPYRPSGSISNSSYIAFEWEDVGHDVSDYRLQVVGNNEDYFRMDRWFKVSDIYVGKGVCYVQTDLYLPAGSYSWRVQAATGGETSGWSSWKGFSVSGYNPGSSYYYNYTNTIPTCLSPTGTITVTSPNFQWRTVTGAAYYMVKLYDSTGSVLFDRQVTSSGNCTAEICTWTPDYKLTKNGNYSWSVLSYGGNNALWSSASGSFMLQGAVAQKAMSFVSPKQNGLLTQDAPVIIWTDPGAATAIFHVEIFSKANKQLFSADLNREQAWCDGQTCSIEFKTIPDAENYRITITPYSDLNTKGDAISLVFSKGSKILKLNSPKEGSTVQARPLFRWNMDASDTNVSYELILTDAANNVTTISPLGCTMEGVTCEDGEMFFSPAISLKSGAYTAKLGLYNSTAVSPELHFTVK